jgi:hypothetical protein
MKKVLTLASVLALAACGQEAMKYQETGLLCEDATHNSKTAQITLDVKANDKVADVVVNGEALKLNAEPQQESLGINYYGTNANNEKVKLVIVTAEDGNVNYMLGINSDEKTYGCAKKAEEPKAEEAAAK